MNKGLKAAIIIVGGTVLAMLAGPNGPLGGFWRPLPIPDEPTGAVLAGLMAAGIVEALGFGAALALLALGRPLFLQATSTPSHATVAQVAAAWLLGSWWPHTALHMHLGVDPTGLMVLEVVFHAGSIVAFALLLWAVLTRTARQHRPDRESSGRLQKLSN